MKLFEGLPSTDYQDLFRAIGALIDESGLRDVRLWEHEGGLILQGRQVNGNGRYQTHLLTDEDLRQLLANAYAQRNQRPASFLNRG